MVALVTIFIGAFLAFCVSVLAGGGAGLVLIPLLGLALPAASVPAALSIGTAVSSASRLSTFWSAVRWDIARRFVPAAVPFAVLGAWLLTLVPSIYLEFVLGVFLIGNVVFAMRRERRATGASLQASQAGPRCPRVFLSCVGASAGFISGFAGAVGVLFNDIYIRLGLKKEEIVATRAANEIMLHLVKIAAYAAFGVMSGETVLIGAVIAAAALLATPAAKRALGHLRESSFRRLNYAAMGIAGIAMVIAAGGEMSARHGVTVHTDVERDGVELSIRWPGARVSTEWNFGHRPQIEWKAVPKASQRGPQTASL